MVKELKSKLLSPIHVAPGAVPKRLKHMSNAEKVPTLRVLDTKRNNAAQVRRALAWRNPHKNGPAADTRVHIQTQTRSNSAKDTVTNRC